MAEELYPIVSGIGQAAVSGLAHDQEQEDYTAKETPGRGLNDQEHHLVSSSNIEVLLVSSFSFNFVYVFFFPSDIGCWSNLSVAATNWNSKFWPTSQ